MIILMITTLVDNLHEFDILGNLLVFMMDRYHPDKNANNPEASELFKEVAFSYSILSDPEKRRQYDSLGFEVTFLLCLLMICGYILVKNFSSVLVLRR